ncbi:MAG: hypothetical protein JWQ49_607 [Edaphobacter sp.]|nr:hypothetical protein [Edaphobacter sp.]
MVWSHGEIAVVILNKNAERDLELTLDFGPGCSGAAETARLHAPALDSREAHITREPKRASLKHGHCAVKVPHASGMRVTVREVCFQCGRSTATDHLSYCNVSE